MDQFIFFCLVWAIVFCIIPFERIKVLSIVGVIGFVWMVIVDNVSTNLGYYSYKNSILSIGQSPIFQNLAEGGLGIIMLNWLKENSFTKLGEVILVGLSFVALHQIYIQRGTFAYGSFNPTLDYIQHIAALSIFIWTSLAIVGEKKVYSGIKSRFRGLV